MWVNFIWRHLLYVSLFDSDIGFSLFFGLSVCFHGKCFPGKFSGENFILNRVLHYICHRWEMLSVSNSDDWVLLSLEIGWEGNYVLIGFGYVGAFHLAKLGKCVVTEIVIIGL